MVEVIQALQVSQLRVGLIANANLPAAPEGTIMYDTTNHKLMIRVAAAWETITSA